MKLYMEPTTTIEDLHRLAWELDVTLYQATVGTIRSRGKFAGKREFSFLLRPGKTDRFRLIRDDSYTKSGRRRIWAVCWHGHWHFMRRVFALDPSATFKTAIDTWAGLDDFLARAEHSGQRNIGSIMYPSQYREACDCAESGDFVLSA
jgi:hypothetical protein